MKMSFNEWVNNPIARRPSVGLMIYLIIILFGYSLIGLDKVSVPIFFIFLIVIKLIGISKRKTIPIFASRANRYERIMTTKEAQIKSALSVVLLIAFYPVANILIFNEMFIKYNNSEIVIILVSLLFFILTFSKIFYNKNIIYYPIR